MNRSREIRSKGHITRMPTQWLPSLPHLHSQIIASFQISFYPFVKAHTIQHRKRCPWRILFMLFFLSVYGLYLHTLQHSLCPFCPDHWTKESPVQVLLWGERGAKHSMWGLSPLSFHNSFTHSFSTSLLVYPQWVSKLFKRVLWVCAF